MTPRDAAFVIISVALAHAARADACTPIAYDMGGLAADSTAETLVADSARIELMRVVSRREVRADPLYAEFYGQVYEFRLESVELLDGRRGQPLRLYGLDPAWLADRLPDFPEIRREPLWWLTQEGYAELQDTRLLDPADQGSVVCVTPMTFAVGADYLVFRDASSALLASAFSGDRFEGPQRPVIERIYGRNDPWLREVLSAIEDNPQPPPSLWLRVFEAVFGYARPRVANKSANK